MHSLSAPTHCLKAHAPEIQFSRNLYLSKCFSSNGARGISYLNGKKKFSETVRTSDFLKIEDMKDLFEGNIAALRIPHFSPPLAVNHALRQLKSKEVVDYENAEGVGKFQDIGMAYFEAENDVSKKAYYDTRVKSLQAVRNVFAPYLSPIDKMRVLLDEKWPEGASLLNLGEGPMYVGLIRAVKKEILPHEDKLERDDPAALDKVHYMSQIAFNCYLSVPGEGEGGALQLWDLSLGDNEYDSLRGKSYGIHRSVLPKPIHTIQPAAGELIAFNGRYIHAVTENLNDKIVRTAVSGFILYQGNNRPLRLWS